MRKATEEWLISARDDLETIAEIVDNPQLTHVVAFHAQQCLEKAFKAILEEREEEIPHLHNLVTLNERAGRPTEGEKNMDVLDRLNQLYIEARYPGERGLLPAGKPSQEEAKLFQEVASRLYEQIHGRLENQ